MIPAETSPTLAEDVAATQRQTLLVLSTGQVFGAIGVASGLAVGTLLAAEVAGSEAVAGLAQTGTVLGSALGAVPISRLMAARGRRVGLVAGYAGATVGAALVVVAAQASSSGVPTPVAFTLLLIGMALFGVATTAGLLARFAAADLAAPGRRGQALSLVVWAGTIGAVLGPNLAEPGGQLGIAVGLPPLAGSFLLSLAGFVAAGLVIWLLLRPDPLLLARRLAPADSRAEQLATAPTTVRGSLEVVRRSPGALLGLVVVALAHTVMISVMVMTPVHMDHGGAALRVIGLVISVHVAGMFAFSPLVGWLADRAGRIPVIVVGGLLLLASTAVSGTAPGSASTQLGVGLFLLGLGWSCCMIAGSTLLTESVPLGARPGVQGTSDLVMGLSAAVGGAASGVVLGVYGYSALNLFAAVFAAWLLGVAVVSRRRGAPPSMTGDEAERTRAAG